MATVYRSSITGGFVTVAYAMAHPDTTQHEHIDDAEYKRKRKTYEKYTDPEESEDVED